MDLLLLKINKKIYSIFMEGLVSLKIIIHALAMILIDFKLLT